MTGSTNIESAINLRQQLIQRRATLLRSVIELDHEVGRVQSFIDSWHYYAGMDVNDLAAAPSPSALLNRNPSKEVVAAKVVDILKGRSGPMKTRELLSALQKVGVVIYGKKPRATLSTMLSRMPSMVKRTLDRRHWAIAERH